VIFFNDFLDSCVGELYTVACSPTDEALVATGAGDDVGFLWRILNGEWASQLNGIYCFLMKDKY